MVDRKQIFVAYPYGAYPKKDYRRIFKGMEDEYGVVFIFADEKITNMHIMSKIKSYIEQSDFSIFDITSWNPNVTLELGYAMATNKDWYIAINPEKTEQDEVPSDIKGIDRIQYTTYSDLEEQLAVLLEQRYAKKKPGIESYVALQKEEMIKMLERQPGLKISEIAQILDVPIPVAQLVIKSIEDDSIETTGIKRGTRYYLKGTAPKKSS